MDPTITWVLIPMITLVLLSSQAVVWGKENGEQRGDANAGAGKTGSGTNEGGRSGEKSATNRGNANANVNRDSDKEFQMFQKLFRQKRIQQQEATQSILASYDYQQQFKLIDMLFDKMQQILSESRGKLMEYGFTAGMPFPTEETTKEGVSLLLENLAFLGDIVLRLPDITHSLYNKKKQFREVVRWAVIFTEESGFFDESHRKLMNLMSQELRLIKREPEYVNPFKKEEVTPEVPTPKKKKEKKPRKKGPRISKAEL